MAKIKFKYKGETLVGTLVGETPKKMRIEIDGDQKLFDKDKVEILAENVRTRKKSTDKTPSRASWVNLKGALEMACGMIQSGTHTKETALAEILQDESFVKNGAYLTDGGFKHFYAQIDKILGETGINEAGTA